MSEANMNIINYGKQFWCDFPNSDEVLKTLKPGEVAYIESIETGNYYILAAPLKHWTNINSFKVKELEIGSCECLKTNDKDEYWGYWLECECGYRSNTEGATYCGGCGNKIRIIGTTAGFEHYGER